MIYLDTLGRCGNQFFQFAFARKIAGIQNDEITVNFGILKDYQKDYGDSFSDVLCDFEASRHYTKTDTLPLQIKKNGSISQKAVYKIYKYERKLCGRRGGDVKQIEKKYRFLLAKFGIFLDCIHAGQEFSLKKVNQKNIFLKGYFERPEYFDSIRDTVLSDYTPLAPRNEKNREMYARIDSENSVCVSFRKWEVDGRECCGKEYYQKAFDYISTEIENPLFVIFSNDVEWVKKHFDLPENCIFEDGTDTIPEKIRLMSSCKHFILSNSTFSWWVQYLGRCEDKKVVSPLAWCEGETEKNPLITADFVTL